MSMCKHCGAPIIFRHKVKMPNGTIRVSPKPIPIHTAQPCTKK